MALERFAEKALILLSKAVNPELSWLLIRHKDNVNYNDHKLYGSWIEKGFHWPFYVMCTSTRTLWLLTTKL